jgi:hypothetical protein
MLEILVRRHYRGHELRDLRRLIAARRTFVVADYTLDEQPRRLVTTVAESSDLDASSDLVAAIDAQLEDAPAGHPVVLDLYLSWPGAPDSVTEVSDSLQRVLRTLPFAGRVRRTAVAVCPGGERPVSYFTFRPGPEGVVEDNLVRGLHPMVGRRLNLWRLRDFEITGSTRRRTCCCTTASHPTMLPTSGSWRSRRSASWPSSGTPRGA